MATRSLSLTVIRPEDLLLLRLDFLNVDYTPASGVAPATIGGQAQARLVVHFQPQHITEQAFWEATEGATQTKAEIDARQPLPPETGIDLLPAPGSVGARMAGPTRLVFSIPAGTTFPLTIDGVLEALTSLPLRVPPVAAWERSGCLLPVSWLRALGVNPPPRISEPARDETAIEAPYRLILSPDSLAKWTHAPLPVTHDQRTELWHTILGTRRADRDPRVRAVWSPDYTPDPPQPGHDHQPFRTSLDKRDRHELVRLTSDYYIRDEYKPEPVRTDRLMLTTLGAWLDLDGHWDAPLLPAGGSLTVEQWQHKATMGRDHYVKVVYKGFLFPFRHRASLVKITERKFRRNPADANGFIAYNLQRMFIIVREPLRTYTPRDMPLRSIEITDLVTPDLDKPENSQVDSLGQQAFWPRIFPKGGAATDFRFRVIARDWENHAVEFSIPQIFVDADVESDPALPLKLQAVFGDYALPANASRRTAPLHGQPLALAPPKVLGKEDTTFTAKSITFGATPEIDIPRFRPFMAEAATDNPAVNDLIGKSVPATIVWEKTYIDPTLSTEVGAAIGNAAQIFARVVSKTDLEFPTDKAGGLAAPNMAIKGLSRSLGPVGDDVDAMITGFFVPAKILPKVELMGGILLSDIITQPFQFDNASSTQKLPQLTSIREGNIIRTTYVWTLSRAELQESNLFKPGPGGSLTLRSEVFKDLSSTAPPTSTTFGELKDFGVTLLPKKDLTFATIRFKSVTFTALPGKKLDTDVQLDRIDFEGILKFVNELREFIPLDGFNDPPAIQLTPPPDVGVEVGFSLGIPTIGIGVMTMQNVSLSAGFFLPLFSPKSMTFRFAFCERHQPFILTVTLFGGGGFFAITVGLDGVISLEAALEFGASIALNLGVASGQASIMAGIYYQAKAGEGFELTAYFRACGSLSVLGIITVSVEFYLGLTYASKGMKHGGHLWGQATLKVKIKIIFFSISVGISMEREFAGSDPSFRALLPSPSDWKLYCEAFDPDYPAPVGD